MDHRQPDLGEPVMLADEFPELGIVSPQTLGGTYMALRRLTGVSALVAVGAPDGVSPADVLGIARP